MRIDATGRKGALRRISIKAKIIAVLVILVVIAFAIVASFAAGFATGTVLRETSQRDLCNGLNGKWNEENGICVEPAALAEPTPSVSATADAYSCGDGTRFALELTSSSSARFTLMEGPARDLTIIREGSLTRYEDPMVTIVPDGIDATYINKQQGTNVSCTMDEPGIGPE